MNADTLVVGAGIAGLLLAVERQRRGERVLVLEKSRGVGGRMATKRVGEAVFDQGAQFFTARDPRFGRYVDEWRREGKAAVWVDGTDPRYIGLPAMTAVAKSLAAGLTVKTEYKATAVRRTVGGWEIDIEEHGIITARKVVLTTPVPQALALLAAGGTVLPADLAAGLAAVTYDPCLAWLAVLAGPSTLPAEGLRLTEGPMRWLADNTRKGVSPGVAAITVHASAAFSAERYGQSELEIAQALRPPVEALCGARVVSSTLHRWKFSQVRDGFAAPYVWLGDVGLGFAGDAFGGPRVEGAALSGLALAEAVG